MQIMRPHYPMRTLEDILPKLSGATFFTKLDARSGYWAIKLSEKSSFLTTFNTPFGRYRFLRLPFGLRSSQDEFQKQIDESFEGLSGVVAIVDDILVFGRDREEHDANLRRVLQRCRERGIRLNEEKLEVGMKEVPYFGHLITSEGLRQDPSKTAAVTKMKPPENKGELETILGMMNYLSKFAPNLADVTGPMRQLLLKDSEFVWDDQQQKSFDQAKDLITKTPLLAFFDPKTPVTLQVDASKYGLGATLLQEGKPVAYASKSLTPAEVNYAQIEKEMFAILFGCKRFHQYVYGRKVLVETDHKPLVSISKKPIYAAPPRLMRMMLQLQRYDLELRHLPGKEIPVADTLSRKFLPDTLPHLSEGIEEHVHSVMANVPFSDNKLQAIKRMINEDPQMCSLKEVVVCGWPNSRSQCSSDVVDYWNYRDEISVVDDLLLKGHKIIIPRCLREEMLNRAHAGHMGIEKTSNRARDIMFWPGMSNDIYQMITSCGVCLKHQNANAKEPLLQHTLPDYPWQNVASDLFKWNNQDYIIVVDYYSRYFELSQLRSTTSKAVIEEMKRFFATHGIPQKLVSDNGPQYVSEEFHRFAKEWDFYHDTSSPRYPQSNGLAERTVQTAKRLLSKAMASGSDPYIALLEYRSTPIIDGKSPSELLMSRRLRSVLPVTPDLLKPSTVESSIRDSMEDRQRKQKHYFDRSSKPLRPLNIGDSVRIRQENKTWSPAKITHKVDTRSYIATTPDGASYRRNRRHLNLIKTNETVRDNIDTKLTDQTPETLDKQNSDGSEPYVTRSGRVVKPIVIPSM